MSGKQTQPGDSSVDKFIAAIVDETRRNDARNLTELAASTTGFEPAMWGPAIIGFGSRHYRYESGREGDEPLMSFSPRKAALVLYGVLAADEHASEIKQLGPHSTGKDCIYIKELSKVDLSVLRRMIQNAVKTKK